MNRLLWSHEPVPLSNWPTLSTVISTRDGCGVKRQSMALMVRSSGKCARQPAPPNPGMGRPPVPSHGVVVQERSRPAMAAPTVRRRSMSYGIACRAYHPSRTPNTKVQCRVAAATEWRRPRPVADCADRAESTVWSLPTSPNLDWSDGCCAHNYCQGSSLRRIGSRRSRAR